MKIELGKTQLKKGDVVMVIAGGSGTKRANKGKTGKILSFIGDNCQRAVVEGLNFVTRHKASKKPGDRSGKVPMESPIHVSNLMFYADKAKQPVKLKSRVLADGKKVRGYMDPTSNEFVQIDN